ncbi:MAG: hypothetical protein ACN4G0_03990 [Polyangiales bacterium]
MPFSRTSLVRFIGLATLGLVLSACGESATSEPRGLNLVYCDNPDVAAPSCGLTGYSLQDDSALHAKLSSCAIGGCHGDPLAATTWNLDMSGTVQSALSALTVPVGTRDFYLVDDVDPDCSQMLSEVSERPVGAVRMPVTGAYWNADEVDCLRSYLHELYPPSASE